MASSQTFLETMRLSPKKEVIVMGLTLKRGYLGEESKEGKAEREEWERIARFYIEKE